MFPRHTLRGDMMSFSVYFANSNKSENSTHAFSTSGLNNYNCTLKAGTSISNPVLEFQTSYDNFVLLSKNNVAYIGSWNRYYFVTDWRFDGRLCICSLSVDVLASYWDQLRVKYFYVTRSASKRKGDIVDTQFPVTAGSRRQYVEAKTNPILPATGFKGVYIVGIINKTGGMDGCLNYYCFGDTEFRNFMGKIFTISNYGTLGTTGTNNDTLTSDLAEILVNPLQYISSIMWYPYTVNEIITAGFTSSTTNVECGYTTISMGATVYKYDDTTVAKQFTNVVTLTIPKHPDASGAEFLNLSPYSEYRLTFYPFGSFNIDPEYLQGFTDLYLCYTIDMRTGLGVLNVGTSVQGTDASNWRMPQAFMTVESQIGVPIPTSNVQIQMQNIGFLASTGIIAGAQGLFSGIGSTVKSGFSEAGNFLQWLTTGHGAREGAVTGSTASGSLIDDIGKAIDNSGIGNAMLQAMASPNISGSQGTMGINGRMDVALSAWFKWRAPTDPAHFGYPLCSLEMLDDLEGYTVCSHAIAQVYGATFAEKRKIENFLNSGFYIE